MVDCEKRRGVVKQALAPGDIWMGKPTIREDRILFWIHRDKKRTRGTETSKYPKEKKSIEIPKVAASEMGGAQSLMEVLS